MSDNISYFYNALTGDEIESLSQGKIKRLSPYAAAGLIGSWMVETGNQDLANLDVVERGNNNAGRGLSQYSHSRRGPYDRARQQAISAGEDPNSAAFQFRYFVEEYMGKHDPAPGKSLIGWTRSLENLPKFTSVAQAAKHFTDNYFRPSTPHLDRRTSSGESIYRRFLNAPKTGPQTPKPQPPSLSPIFSGKWVDKLVKKFGPNATVGSVFVQNEQKNARLMSKLDKRAYSALESVWNVQNGNFDQVNKKQFKKGWKYLKKTGLTNVLSKFGIQDNVMKMAKKGGYGKATNNTATAFKQGMDFFKDLGTKQQESWQSTLDARSEARQATYGDYDYKGYNFAQYFNENALDKLRIKDDYYKPGSSEANAWQIPQGQEQYQADFGPSYTEQIATANKVNSNLQGGGALDSGEKVGGWNLGTAQYGTTPNTGGTSTAAAGGGGAASGGGGGGGSSS
jgi:hypothetical protein